MTETIEYYNKNAEAFRDNTQNVVFTETQEKFIEYLKPGAEYWISDVVPEGIRSIFLIGDSRQKRRTARQNLLR